MSDEDRSLDPPDWERLRAVGHEMAATGGLHLPGGAQLGGPSLCRPGVGSLGAAPHPRGRRLKIWMAFKEHGLDRLRRAIEKNVEEAGHLAGRIQQEPELELMAPVPLNLVTFRYRGRGLPEARLDGLNAEVVMRVQESGLAVPSTTRLHGRTVIRLAIVNHRTRLEDLDALLEAVLRTGRELAGAQPADHLSPPRRRDANDPPAGGPPSQP